MKHDPVSDEVLDKAMAGDPNAFRIVVERNQSFVYAVAFKFLNSRNDAQDIAQEVFIRLWKNIKSYRKDVKLTTWLYRIVANLCLDELKSRHRKNSRSTSSLEDVQHLADPVISGEDVERAELRALIRLSAETLTPKQKAVFILRDLEDLTVEEVAVILNIPPGVIKSNLYHARTRISAVLENYMEQYKCRKP